MAAPAAARSDCAQVFVIVLRKKFAPAAHKLLRFYGFTGFFSSWTLLRFYTHFAKLLRNLHPMMYTQRIPSPGNPML
jgi:hypothetical protein